MEEQPMSPVLSIKKSTKESSDNFSASPVLSIGRKRKRKRSCPSSSPVIVRSSSRSTIRKTGGESPDIEDISSPPLKSGTLSRVRGLEPKSLFPDSDDITDEVCSQASPPNCEDTVELIEEEVLSEKSVDEEDLVIHEKTLSDAEDSSAVDITTTCRSRSDTSFSISQTCSSLCSLLSTPDKGVTKQSQYVTTGSARKKKQYLPNGLAKQLSKLLIRQETDYRLWRFQQKTKGSSTDDATRTLRLRIDQVTTSGVHHFADCQLEMGDLASDRVRLVLTPERWERFRVGVGDIVTIYEPWYSSMEMGGVTLLLSFNLLRKEVVSKLSNASNNDSIRCDGACSSASADNITVAENRCPSTVTVLQTWSCPCQDCPCNFHSS